MRPRLVAFIPVLVLASCAAALAGAPPEGAGSNPHGAYVEDCSLCHAAESWLPARPSSRFDHARFGFPLKGAHAQVSCRACHVSVDFARQKPKSACVSCHQDVHEGEFGTDCARCHTPRSFIDHQGMVRSHVTTRFPLVGAHAAADCEGCHRLSVPGGSSYVNLATDCRSCHLSEYLATTNPNHQASGFPQECEQCHAPTAWRSTVNGFDHAGTGFPLTGAHRTAACASCHVNGVYQGTSTACVSCHQNDYNGTTDPPHGPSGFSTDCATCHVASSWSAANFDHDALYFPIYSGAHKGRWSSCSTCHINAQNYPDFSCFAGCHEHADPIEMASRHQGVSGYQYTSIACYTCHPRGSH